MVLYIHQQTPSNGFSLIELLCVLSLVGLLTTLAYPSYTKHLAHARRIDGQSALLDLATRLEAHHMHQNTYEHLKPNTSTSPGGWYQLKIIRATKNNYILEASAIGPQAKLDSQCKSLTLDANGHEGPQASCW
ncbi:MAG: type IV pilin protein [Legionella sp.]|nr:type IV pilin protein [Legionella sp.]